MNHDGDSRGVVIKGFLIPDKQLHRGEAAEIMEPTMEEVRSTETSDGLVVIQAQLNNLGRKIKKVNEFFYAAQVGCESCGGPHYSKDCPLKEEAKTFKEAYYTQFGVPFPQEGRYRAAALGFYLRDSGNPLGVVIKGFLIPDKQLHRGEAAEIMEPTMEEVRSTETSDGLVVIQAQLNNLGRKIKKVNEFFYAAQVGCESCGGPHYSKDCPLKEEAKTFEEAYYTQFGVPFPQEGRYRAAALGFYLRDSGNPLYQERRQTIEESLSKFMAESAKRHDENYNLIKII
nr:hypothetical protein [Tanacetum cinerariifolium]